MNKRKKHKEGLEREKALFLGVGIAAAALLLFSALLSAICLSTQNPAPLTDAAGLASLMLSGAFGGFITAKLCKEGGFLISTLSSLIFMLLLLLISLISAKGSLPPRCLVNYLCYMGICALFAFFGSRKRRRVRH